jgi:hypothetical protein
MRLDGLLLEVFGFDLKYHARARRSGADQQHDNRKRNTRHGKAPHPGHIE